MTLICFSFCSWHRKHFFVSEVPFTQLTSYIIYCFYNSVQPFRCLQDVTCSWALLSLVYKKRNRASRSQHRDFPCHRTSEWKIPIQVFQFQLFTLILFARWFPTGWQSEDPFVLPLLWSSHTRDILYYFIKLDHDEKRGSRVASGRSDTFKERMIWIKQGYECSGLLYQSWGKNKWLRMLMVVVVFETQVPIWVMPYEVYACVSLSSFLFIIFPSLNILSC